MEFSFHYQARNLDGEAVSGRVEAETRQAALGLLRSRNLFVVKISQARAGKRRLSVPRGRVRVKELAIFCRQFAVMNAAGIHLLQSLHDLREQTTDRLLQKIISEAVVSLEKGKSLTEAFMINSGSLPPIMINMLLAAYLPYLQFHQPQISRCDTVQINEHLGPFLSTGDDRCVFLAEPFCCCTFFFY